MVFLLFRYCAVDRKWVDFFRKAMPVQSEKVEREAVGDGHIWRMVLPTEEELRQELERDREEIEARRNLESEKSDE
ncbi:hypothetical protein [Chthoniobacter flavus]|uniref:hypothetical protein n=1 Tax=Chthoniobacter flavus TaxID=191863 RepID=UPI00104A59A1|nr:hypothetical protein [Chthoniobacter flavus]